jgi:hypothetical protein
MIGNGHYDDILELSSCSIGYNLRVRTQFDKPFIEGSPVMFFRYDSLLSASVGSSSFRSFDILYLSRKQPSKEGIKFRI